MNSPGQTACPWAARLTRVQFLALSAQANGMSALIVSSSSKMVSPSTAACQIADVNWSVVPHAGELSSARLYSFTITWRAGGRVDG